MTLVEEVKRLQKYWNRESYPCDYNACEESAFIDELLDVILELCKRIEGD